MNCLNDTPLSRKNKHINAYESGQLQLLNAKGLSPYAIGKRLGRASDTIRNELRGGTVPQIKGNKTIEVYYPDIGQAVYETNRKNCVPKNNYLNCEKFMEHVSLSLVI